MVITAVKDINANEGMITYKQDQILSEIQNELNEQLKPKPKTRKQRFSSVKCKPSIYLSTATR